VIHTRLILKSKIHRYSQKLFLIELIPPVPGFDQFMGAWLFKGQVTFLVDVGPAVTLPFLLAALESLQITRLDYIFLTHIHMDHAGGVGHLSVKFPQTPVVCHANGLPHLVDPSRLLAGSLKTLGDTARAYGPMNPVPERLLVAADRFDSDGVMPVLTPGHSPHHVSYLTLGVLFAGEAGGVCMELPDGRSWLRPATPPQHVLTTALSSIDALIAVSPDTICYGHFGLRKEACHYLSRHRNQLLLWEQLIGKNIKNSRPEDLINSCLTQLLKEDPELAGYEGMTPAQQKRETFFLINSVKGFVGYLGTVTP
jgi:glyoxylase-like metal-dependent hydrolase (beta-lactamase superfamily II)